MKPTVSETNVRIRGRSATVVAGGLTAVLALAACGSGSGSAGSSGAGSGGDATTLTLYNAQHEDLMTLMVAGFTKETGIKVEMRNGERLRAGEPDRAGGRRVPGRRVPHRELPGHDPGRRRQGLHQGRRGRAQPGAVAVRPQRRQLGRFRRPLDGAGLQQRPSSAGSSCPPRSWTWPSRQWKGKSALARPAPTSRPSSARSLALEGEAKRGAVAQGPEGERQGLPAATTP